MAHLLIVEPDLWTRGLLVIAAEGAGHETTADALLSGGGGPDQLAQFDALVIEPACPEGRALLHHVAELGAPIPILCVSVWPSEMVDAPVVDATYLMKPFRRTDFLIALERVLRGTPG